MQIHHVQNLISVLKFWLYNSLQFIQALIALWNLYTSYWNICKNQVNFELMMYIIKMQYI